MVTFLFVHSLLYSFINPFCSALNSLFHVVVENDDISTRIIEMLTREEDERVTFIPLYRVKVTDISFPQSPDFEPLLKKLKYPTNLQCAFEQALHAYSLI